MLTERFGGTLLNNFARIEDGGGFVIRKLAVAMAATDPNTMTMKFDPGRAQLTSRESWTRFGIIEAVIHELVHVFTQEPNKGVYNHIEMATAANSAAKALRNGWTEALPLRSQFSTGEEYQQALSSYFDRGVSFACKGVKLKP